MLNYMIYLLAFAAGSIIGLLYSYKQHGEPFVAVPGVNILALVISIIGWFFAFNGGNVILSAIGFFLGGLVMGERPGYGRKETAIGLIISIIAYVLLNSGMM